MKKIFIGILLLICFFGFRLARAEASVTINEVMYDLKDVSDTDHEWVELHNDSSSAVSVEGWKWNDGSNHTLNAPPQNGGQGTLSIDPDGYMILSGNAATFLSDHPGFAGTVIDTVMSLNNAGATLSVLDKSGKVIDTVAYTSALGASGDGNSLSRTDSQTLIPTMPTPGFQNASEVVAPPPSDGQDPSSQSTDTSTDNPSDQTASTSSETQTQSAIAADTKNKWIPISAKILAPAKGMAGVTIDFSSKVTGTMGEDLWTGKFVWSMGNGTSRTDMARKDFSYTYQYPGEYVVYLEYYQYSDQIKPIAADRFIIKVGAPALSVSSIYPDGSFDITNQGSQEVDLAGWTATQGTLLYAFGPHLVVLPKDKIRIIPSLTHFSGNGDQPKLLDPSTTEIHASSSQAVIQTGSSVAVSSVKSSPKKNNDMYKNTETPVVPLSLEPEAASQKTSLGFSFSPKNLIEISISLLLIAVLCSIFFIRNGKKENTPDSLESEVFEIEEAS